MTMTVVLGRTLVSSMAGHSAVVAVATARRSIAAQSDRVGVTNQLLYERTPQWVSHRLQRKKLPIIGDGHALMDITCGLLWLRSIDRSIWPSLRVCAAAAECELGPVYHVAATLTTLFTRSS